MGKITKVPNGPLIKKKGPYAGSTLKAGGAIKKAQSGETIKGSRKGRVFKTTKERTTSGGLLEPYKYTTKSIDTTGYSKGKPTYELKSEEGEGDKTFSKSTSTKVKKVPRKQVPSILKDLNKGKNGSKVKKGQEGVKIGNTTYTITNSTKDTIKGNPKYPGIRTPRTSMSNSKTDQGISSVKRLLKSKAKNGVKTKKAMMGMGNLFKDNPIYKKSTEARGMIGNAMGIPGKPIVKNGDMIKRADGSYSKRGLWDNIRANKGSGKKPTAAMLKQERKIKAKK
jgi:hypothetical protein